MAKVTEYPRITKMKDNDILLVDGPDGTRTILQTDASKQMGGEVVMVNETAGDSTKVVINTTNEDIELATMADLEPVEEDVDELKTQISDIVPDVRNIKAEWVTNYRINTNAVGDTASPDTATFSSGYAYTIFPCKKNEHFKATCTGATPYRGAVLADSEYKIYKLFGNSLSNYDIVAEKDGYVICNTYNLSNPYGLVKLESYSDVLKQFDHVGIYYESVFSVTAGTGHSATVDQAKVDIKAGTKYYATVSGSINRWQIWAYYEDGTNEQIAADSNYLGTAPKNVVALGISASASWISQSGTVSLSAFTEDSLYGKTINTPPVKEITTTVIGAKLPADTSNWSITAGYASAMKNAIDAWMGYYAGDDRIIPFIVHTDQHGTLSLANKDVFRAIDYLVNWDSISAIFNLGDTVVDHWENDDTNTNPLLRNGTLETALKCLENIPVDKRIDVFGNHDTWYIDGSDPITYLPSLQYNNPYFLSDGLITRKVADNSGLKIVYDTKRNVKYLILAAWDYAEKSSGYTGYQWYWIDQDHLNWIVAEMAKNDGYDLILVSHVPLEMGNDTCVDPITGDPHIHTNSIGETDPIYITHQDSFLVSLWNARKNKTAGTVSSNGVSVSYDFTNCENDCYCALSGHTHWDGVQYLNNGDNNGLLAVSFDFFKEGQTVHFGVIDRGLRKIKVWKLSNDSNTPAVTAWEKPLDKA